MSVDPKPWFIRAETEEIYERFIFLYISLVILARFGPIECGEDDDRCFIVGWFGMNANMVISALEEHGDDMRWLAARQGGAILAPPNPDGACLEAQMRKLSKHWLDSRRLKDKEHARKFATLLITVRNNVVHGRKDEASQEDQELVRRVGCVLKRVLQRVQSW